MPLGRGQGAGYIGWNPDPTAVAQYGVAAEATRANPETRQAAFDAALAAFGSRKARRTMLVAFDIPAISNPATTQDVNLPNELIDRAASIVNAVFIPNGALTGQATNNRTWSLVNKGPTGAGNTSMGAGFTSGSGNNLVADTPVTLAVTTPAVAAADRLAVRSTSNGTGQTDPGGTVVFEIDRA